MITIGGKTPETIFIASKEVAAISINNDQVWVKTQPTPPTPTIDYFYIENTSGSTNNMTFTKNGTPASTDLQYSKDKSNWTPIDQTMTIQMNSGEKLYLRSTTGLNSNWENQYNIKGEKNHTINGSVSTLIDYTDTQITEAPAWFMCGLFNGDTYLTGVNFSLGNIDTLNDYSFSNCFNTCTNLTSIATDFSVIKTVKGDSSFSDCFRGCSSLQTPPDFSGITFLGSDTSNVFYRTFQNCTNLQSTPDFRNITYISKLKNNFRYTFRYCTKLYTIYSPSVSSWDTSGTFSNWLTGASPGSGVTGVAYMYTNPSVPTSASGIPTLWRREKPDYFYIENEYAGQNTLTLTTTVTGSPSSSYYSDNVQYSKDLTNWTTITFDTSIPYTITMYQGEKVYFRNDSGYFNFSSLNDDYHTVFTCSQANNAGGDIRTLLDYTDISGVSLNDGCFRSLFQGNTGLVDASGLNLPSDTAYRCYYSMFYGCTSLTDSPALPSNTLSTECYRNMFRGCTSIVTATTLPNTTLAYGCYQQMFYGCTSLTVPPVLMSATLAERCYSSMFNGCSSLDNITTYANDISASNCINNWLGGVAQTGTFYNEGSAAYTPNSASGIPTGWTEVTPSPVDYFYIQNTYAGQNDITLETIEGGVTPPANTHATSVEYSKDLTNWTTITFVTGYANAQTITMDEGETVYFRNSSGKFNFDSILDGNYSTSFTNSQSCIVGGDVRTLLDYTDYEAVTVPQGAFYMLLSGNLKITDASRIKLPDEIPAHGCKYMFHANANLTVPPEIPATEVGEYGCESMFSRCSNLTTAPVLKSKTLTMGCYEQMFYDCSLLNSVTIEADDISASGCLTGWLDGVAATGDFYNNGSATYPSGSSGIPTGWTVHNPL